jgi:ribosomal protein S18 acetylase RimI-like enzyme
MTAVRSKRRLRFRVVGPGDQGLLADIFSDIDETFFRPHPFTLEEAQLLAEYAGRDVYALLLDDVRPIAYGMLRGWDEGYTTPSLGIAVRSDARGRGYGHLMMAHLHSQARLSGAVQVRLRVHPDNTVARHLYESLGYVYRGEDRGELVMVADLGTTAGFIGSASIEWAQHLDLVDHDFNHFPEITELFAREEGGEATAFFAEAHGAQLLIPLILRPVTDQVSLKPTPFLDAASAYGYPSPLVSSRGGSGDDFLEEGLDAFVDALRQRGIVSAFIRLHPLLRFPMEALARVGDVVRHGDTVSVDLALSDEEIWLNTSGFHRSSIKRAERLGYVAKMDTEWRHFDTFVTIYQETMARVGAAPFYRFSPAFFNDLREALGDSAHLCVVDIKGEVAAAGLVTEVCGIVQIFLAGSRNKFMQHSPAKLMENFVRYWAKARGNRWFHLGGGAEASNDSLFEFKLGFSPLTHPFMTWRVIADSEAYLRLARQWESRAGVTADGPEGFFPAYRKPLPKAPM